MGFSRSQFLWNRMLLKHVFSGLTSTTLQFFQAHLHCQSQLHFLKYKVKNECTCWVNGQKRKDKNGTTCQIRLQCLFTHSPLTSGCNTLRIWECLPQYRCTFRGCKPNSPSQAMIQQGVPPYIFSLGEWKLHRVSRSQYLMLDFFLFFDSCAFKEKQYSVVPLTLGYDTRSGGLILHWLIYLKILIRKMKILL